MENGNNDELESIDSLGIMLNTAFVNFNIIAARYVTKLDDSKKQRSGQVTRLVWDTEIQHDDNITNNYVAAYARSLNENIMSELNHHGMPTTELLLGGATDIFWNNRRTVELLKPLIRSQVLRLAILAYARLKKFEVGQILDYAYLLVQAEDYTVLDIVMGGLRIFDAWRAKGEEELGPWIELNWLQVCHAEGVIIQQKNLDAAREIYEKNLAIDPVTEKNHGLYMVIVRTQSNNLQSWIGCVAHGRPRDDERVNAMNGFLNSIMAGGLPNHVASLSQEDHPLHLPFKTMFTEIPYKHAFNLEAILEDHKETVKAFGTLAKSILDRPVSYVWHGLSDTDPRKPFDVSDLRQVLTDGRIKSSGLEAMQLAEYALRYVADDKDGIDTKATLNDMLEKETSYHGTNWRKLEGIHEMMMDVAFKHEDWTDALRHLDERQTLQEGVASQEEKVRLWTDYTICYARMGEFENARQSAAKRIRAIGPEGGMDSVKVFMAMLANEVPVFFEYVMALERD